ncbi:hypothetical protein ATANTOWER_017344 [Ataeniobius toweri]|uniref:VWFC domain-containing protein n=1 Tax=Ataeniobius toweri TaxID=208326 RepID=A0ABU7BB21_9TELE|nr:hypothetical protein [Ataeniobius toweri]
MHGHSAPKRENAIDLLAALNLSQQRSGVSRLHSPNSMIYKIRPTAAYLILPQEYSSFLHSNFQGSIGVHLVGRQASGSSATLFSLSSVSSPILQIISSSINKSLHLDCHSAEESLASFHFPMRNPVSAGEWAKLAVSLEPDRLVFYADCQEAFVIEIKNEKRINLDIPHDVVIALGSTPGIKGSKFNGYLRMAKLSLKAYVRRPWSCDNITDNLPLSHYKDTHGPNFPADPSQMFHHDASPSKQETNHRPQEQTDYYPRDIHGDQQQRAAELGPPESPHGVKSVSQKQTTDRMEKLEKRLEELAHMLGMVKAQNMDLQSRVKYLEGCECVRRQCVWEGREVEEGQHWETDPNTVCLCSSGKVTCQSSSRNKGCTHSGVGYDHGAKWRSAENACDVCSCLEGHVCCEREQCSTPCKYPAAPPFNTCCPVCQGCGVNGHDFPNGAVIPTDDPCQECTCENGNVVCSPLRCPTFSCRSPVHHPGECCPRCEECEFESEVYVNGQKFPSVSDPCLHCHCSEGEVSCERMEASCPTPHCSHPAKKKGECCPTCKKCEFDRRVYADGTVFVPAGSGPCLQCRCKAGNVVCSKEKCPPVQCSKPVIDPHLCCPVCKACVLEGVEYENGSSWQPEGPCSSCTCVNGETLCTHMQCPPTECLHPSKITGSCCKICDSCTYNHRVYSNGQRFTTPDQPCHICTCLHGSIHCERRTCPPLNCTNSYTPPGECCPKCPDCSFENRVFINGEAFPNPVSVCEECMCKNGRIDCHQMHCPYPRCNAPLPGTCCQNNCNGCSYAGKEYSNGQDFPHPTDQCRTCSCINGNVQCLMRRCSPLQCSSPNIIPGHCCPQCPGKDVEQTEFLPQNRQFYLEKLESLNSVIFHTL